MCVSESNEVGFIYTHTHRVVKEENSNSKVKRSTVKSEVQKFASCGVVSQWKKTLKPRDTYDDMILELAYNKKERDQDPYVCSSERRTAYLLLVRQPYHDMFLTPKSTH